MAVLFRLAAVSFTYPQEGRGFPPFSLDVAQGECVLLAGPSGCGKSTLARCLSGLIPHLYHGELQGAAWAGPHRTDQTPLWQLAEQVGLVFQNPAAQMLAPSVEEEIIFGLENLGLPAEAVRERVEQALEQFDLLPLRRRPPQTLSGGEQQKLALASILARQPPSLVLDEPLSMLDSTSAFEFVAHLAGLARSGKTIVVCEHRREYLAELPGLRTVTLCPEAPLPTGELALETAWRMGEVAPFTLELDALTVARGERTVLSGLSLALEGGQIVALVGPNGVGKTTLLRALAGVQPFSGQIFVRQAGQAVAPSLGMVFQNPDLQFFNPSVSAEILYRLPDPDLELYAGLLDALDLKRYQQTPPLLLSEGEKRRLALAVALARRPAHGVLLDEPSLGQDARHKAILLRTLKRVAASGRLVIMATHDLELAAHADRLVLLSPGEFLADGLAPGVLQDDLAWRRLGLRVPEWVRRAV